MKKNIDINMSNYESYVIDYLDGKLDTVEKACFIAFLENHSDIKEEITNIVDIELIPEEKAYEYKNKLKKTPISPIDGINEDNYEEYFIAYYEGDLDNTEKNSLEKFLDNNSSLDNEFLLFADLKLSSNTTIVFSEKEELKHNRKIIPVWYSIAAAILLFFSMYWFLNDQRPNLTNKEFSHINKLVPKAYQKKVSSNIIPDINSFERQTPDILPNNELSDPALEESLNVLHEKVYITSLERKTNAGELVNILDFVQLAEPENSKLTATSTSDLSTSLALGEPKTEKNNKSLLAKVFNRQVTRVVSRARANKNNNKKSTDPGYIKVLDKSLLVFNTITGSETTTMKTYNKDGNLTSYQIEGQELLRNKSSYMASK